MKKSIELPFQVNEEVFYLKDNQIKKSRITRIDVEVTEEETKFRFWFKPSQHETELVNGSHVFETKEEALIFVTATIND